MIPKTQTTTTTNTNISVKSLVFRITEKNSDTPDAI